MSWDDGRRRRMLDDSSLGVVYFSIKLTSLFTWSQETIRSCKDSITELPVCKSTGLLNDNRYWWVVGRHGAAQPALLFTVRFSIHEKRLPFLSRLLKRAVQENDKNRELTSMSLGSGAAFCSVSRRCGSWLTYWFKIVASCRFLSTMSSAGAGASGSTGSKGLRKFNDLVEVLRN